MGWKLNVTEQLPDKCIFCLAPHTSNWDFIIGQLYSRAEGMKTNFLMKKEWFFWPLGPLFKKLGGIPVWRSKHSSMTDNLAKTAQERESFQLCITPEGTRKPTEEWKKGFYYIALNAHVPIMLFGLDYKRKIVECTKTFIPTGDYDKDIIEIKQHFKDYKGKHPESFAI
jgi:1-acyl-sn-glycerol-3-phosphate acyltransferase